MVKWSAEIILYQLINNNGVHLHVRAILGFLPSNIIKTTILNTFAYDYMDINQYILIKICTDTLYIIKIRHRTDLYCFKMYTPS